MLLLVTIDVCVADVADQIAVAVELIGIGRIGTVVASVAQAAAIRVALIRIGCLGAIITRIENSCMCQQNEIINWVTKLLESKY